MRTSWTVTLLVVAACGSTSTTTTTPPGDDPPPVAAELLTAETAAYEAAKPVFETYCAACHQQGQSGATQETLDHFDMTAYPFGGHHAMEISKEIRAALGIDGSNPTMPANQPGLVQGDELALIAVWADAFDASHAGGAHEGHGGHHH